MVRRKCHHGAETRNRYISVIPEEERMDLIGAFYRRLLVDGPDSLVVAKAWATWEESTVKMIPDPELISLADREPRWAR